MDLVELRSETLSVLVDLDPPVPAVLWWGPSARPLLGEAPSGALLDRPVPPASLDREAPLTVVPTAWDGFPGRAGIEVHRTGAFAPSLRSAERRVEPASLWSRSVDTTGGISVEVTITVGDVVELTVAVTNEGDADLYVDDLSVSLPVPSSTAELLSFDGHWCGEFTPVRSPWLTTVVVENRRGRTSHDNVPVLFAGDRGFNEDAGRVVGIHLAWSGNSRIRLERLSDGRGHLQCGEILAPGEVRLLPGATHRTPTVVATAGVGLDAATSALHRHVRRGRSTLPPRPVVLNTWEAVYFDHDVATLTRLAEVAASVGVERFVLDDGWFGSRRHDRAGLGDWWVSPELYPDGLAPLVERVGALGMDFGIWVEPEMVNPDSDLYRSHPDWILGNPELTGRNQLVLDLSIEACRTELLDRLDRLLADHDIAYVKWDMNRDLAGAGSHRQTLALYDLLDTLRSRHPGVEFESCASGGGRADFGILGRVERIWTSDCNDPVERQVIQRGFGHLFPPEVMGAHIGPPRAHTTGRTSRLAFRAATAFFGHLGIEWNLLEATDRHLDALRAWIALHKELRPLLHGGHSVRLDSTDPSALAHGVVSPEGAHAVFCHAQLTSSSVTLPGRMVLRGLDRDRVYSVEHLRMPGEVLGPARPPAWMTDGPVSATGEWLQTVGLQLPALLPESALLIRLRAV